jgi:hypothetical protein
MCVLGAERTTTQRALVKDGEARRALARRLDDDLISRFRAVCHFFILLRGDQQRGDAEAYLNLLRFDLK